MRTDILVEPSTAANRRLRLFTLYADYPAALRIKWLNRQVASLAGRSWEPSVELWKLDSAAPAGPIKEMIAQEAGAADVLVIALSSLDQREPALTQWLDSVATLKKNRQVPGLLIGLLGDEEHQAGELGWMVSQLGDFARRTKMDFIWRWMDRDAMHDASWLVPNLQTLLGDKQAVCRQEIAAAASAGGNTGKGVTAVS